MAAQMPVASAALELPNASRFRANYEAYLRSIEKENGAPPQDVMALQQKLHGPGRAREGLRGTHRAMLVDWLIEVVDVFQMSLRSAFLAVGYIDLMLCDHKLTRANFQLLGATCLHIASKCEDVSYIGVEDLANCGDNIYTQKELLGTEEMVLNKLQFRLCMPTALDAVNLLLDRPGLAVSRAANEEEDAAAREANDVELLRSVTHWARYMSELALQDHRFCKYSPFTLGAALVLYARRMADVTPVWSREMAQVTGIPQAELRELTEKVHQVHSTAEFNELQAIRKRYNTPDRNSIAKVLAPPELGISWPSAE